MVDDDATNLEVLRVRLSAQGYEVVAAVDGEDALRRARELKPDLVLLDVMMPKLDGIVARFASSTAPPAVARYHEVPLCGATSGRGPPTLLARMAW